MYISIAVLMSARVDEREAEEFGLEPGTPREGHFIEEELERLMAPYSYETRLIVRNLQDDARWKTVPNYGARFDSWDLEESLLEHFWDRFIALSIEDRIYPDSYTDDEEGAPKGYPVFRTSELPLDLPYEGIITPDGLYHDLWTGENEDNRDLAARLLIEHGDCLAVLCSAHV